MVHQRIVTARGIIDAPAAKIFDLIADPAQQPQWDGNDNLSSADAGQRVTGAGEVFTMRLTNGEVRENHVVEFVENELLAWKPSAVGQPRPGHLWRWELAALGEDRTEVTHTYDWTQLRDQQRLKRAETTTAEMLNSSIERLKAVAEAA